MKRLILALPLLLLIFVLSCHSGPDNKYPDQMKAAEKEMQRDPKVSLEILNNINHEMPAYSKQVRMEYELLLIQALDKTDHSLGKFEPKVDSVINYFKSNGTILQKARTYYYKGGVYRDESDELNAIKWYQKALREIRETSLSSNYEKELAAVICAQLSSILYLSSNYSQALEYALLEYKYSSTPIGKYEAACDLASIYKGMAYINECSVDSVIKYFDLSFELSKSKKLNLKGPSFQDGLLSQAYFFVDLGMKEKANERLKLLDVGSFRKRNSGYYVLGVIYDGLGKTDSALYYYHKTTETKDYGKVSAAYNRLMEHEYRKGNWKAAADYGLKFKVANDSAVKYADAERVSRNLENLENSSLVSDNEELKEKGERQKAIIACLCIAFAAALFAVFFSERKKRRKQKARIAELERGKDEKALQLEMANKQLDADAEARRTLETENRVLSKELRELKDAEKLKRPKAKDFKRSVDQLLSEGNIMSTPMEEELMQAVVEFAPEAEVKMKEYRSRNPMYAKVLGLSLLGYRNIDICRLTGNERNNVTNYYYKIYNDITQKKYTKDADFASDIRDVLSKEGK